jgi:hypothetical protein
MTEATDQTAATPPARRKPWIWISLSLVLAAACGVEAYFLFRPGGRFGPARDTSTPDVYALLRVSAPTAGEAEEYRRSQALLVRSKIVLNAALRDPKMNLLPMLREQSDPLEWLESHIRVDFDLGPDTMRIGVSGDNTDELAVVVAAIRDAYLREIVGPTKERRSEKNDTLKAIYAKFEGRLNEKRAELESAKKRGDKGAFLVDKLQNEIKELQEEQDKVAAELVVPEAETTTRPRIVPLGDVVIRKAM